eukprot:scaffold131566_cov51-Phaeocystis_antarctica.AAC.1
MLHSLRYYTPHLSSSATASSAADARYSTLHMDLTDAVRGLHVADPDLGFKPLLAKLREQQPDLGAGSKEVRKALTALKAESEAALAPPTADEGVAPCSHAVLSLACVGCFRLPSDMDDVREKHP